jgi:hypothetical protein
LQNGEQALASGQFGRAVEYFTSIPKNSRNYGRACKGHGAAVLRMQRWSDALPILQMAHDALSEDPDILVDAGDAARLIGRIDVAENLYMKRGNEVRTAFRLDLEKHQSVRSESCGSKRSGYGRH